MDSTINNNVDNYDDYQTLALLGKGSYGKIFQAKRKSDGLICVLKMIALEGLDEQEKKDTFTESKVMRQIDHPNIVKYYDSFIHNTTMIIVMEYAPGGDLAQKIRAQNNQPFPEETIWNYLIQLAVGLKHLHAQRVLHRDIKSQNVFLDANDNLKIGDLGLARIMGSQSNYAYTGVGTPLYMSPEIIHEDPYNHKSDVWALGCLIYELAALKPPFRATNQVALAKKITEEQPEELPKGYTSEFHFLVFKMLEKDVSKRPDINQVLSYSAVRIRLEKSLQQQKEAQLHKKYKEYTTQLQAHYESLSAQLHAQLHAAQATNQRMEDKAQTMARVLDEKDDQIAHLRIAMQKQVTQQARAFEALVRDKEAQCAKREKAIHDKEIELFQRETALQLTLQKLKEAKCTGECHLHQSIANGISEFIQIHKPVEDNTSLEPPNDARDEEYVDADQFVPTEDEVDSADEDGVPETTVDEEADNEMGGVPDEDSHVTGKGEISSSPFYTPSNYPKTPGTAPSTSRYANSDTPTTPYVPSNNPRRIFSNPKAKPKSTPDHKSAPTTPHPRARNGVATQPPRRNPSSAPAKRANAHAFVPAPSPYAISLEVFGFPAFKMDCLYAWRRTGWTGKQNPHPESIVETRGAVGNVWEGKARHAVFSPCSELLFVYRTNQSSHLIRGLRVRYQHEENFHKILPLPTSTPLLPSPSLSSPSPTPSPSPSLQSHLHPQTHSQPLRYFFHLRSELDRVKDTYPEIAEFILEFSHPNPIDELTVLRFDRKFLEIARPPSTSSASTASTPTPVPALTPTPTPSLTPTPTPVAPTPPPSSPSPHLVPSRTPPLLFTTPKSTMHALTPSHSRVPPVYTSITVPATPDTPSYVQVNGHNKQKGPPRKALADQTNLPAHTVPQTPPTSAMQYPYTPVPSNTPKPSHTPYTPARTPVQKLTMHNYATPIAAAHETEGDAFTTPSSLYINDSYHLESDDSLLTPRNHNFSRPTIEITPLTLPSTIPPQLPPQDYEFARLYAPSPYKPPLPPAYTPSPTPYTPSPVPTTDDESADADRVNGVRTSNGTPRTPRVMSHARTPQTNTRVVYRVRNQTPNTSQIMDAEDSLTEDTGTRTIDIDSHERHNNKVATKKTPIKSPARSDLSADQLEALLTKVKLYQMKERMITRKEDEVNIDTSEDFSSPTAESSILDSHNTTVTNASDVLGAEDGRRSGIEVEPRRGVTTSPHKQLANELLRRNAETKEMLRAKTSSLLQELSITKQLFQNLTASP